MKIAEIRQLVDKKGTYILNFSLRLKINSKAGGKLEPKSGIPDIYQERYFEK